MSVEVPEEFTQAVRDAMADAGLSLRTLGELAANDPDLGRGKDTVALWVAGRQRMWPDEVFALERLLAREPGELSRLCGYLPIGAVPVVKPEDAIRTDATLSADTRGDLLALLQRARERRRGRSKPS